MTCEATVAVICDFLRGRREMVRIVAGDAAELTLTGPKTLAFVHLFELADKTLFSPPRRLHKHCPKAAKRQPGAIIFVAPANAHNSSTASQVALRTDVVAELRRQIGGIDDRHVLAVDRGRTLRHEVRRAHGSVHNRLRDPGKSAVDIG